MKESLLELCFLYNRFKHLAICLDIECATYDGDISVLSFYKPKEGIVVPETFIKNQNLTINNLKESLKDCKLLITFNGTKHDIKKIDKQFPSLKIWKIPHLDLYKLATKLKLSASLKTLEASFGIKRPDGYDENRDRPIFLWTRYIHRKDPNDLRLLVEYNQQDAINLYLLAEELIKKVMKSLEI